MLDGCGYYGKEVCMTFAELQEKWIQVCVSIPKDEISKFQELFSSDNVEQVGLR